MFKGISSYIWLVQAFHLEPQCLLPLLALTDLELNPSSSLLLLFV